MQLAANKLLKTIITIFLLAIFFLLPFVEAFHHHDERGVSLFIRFHKHLKNKESVSSNCAVCGFVYHKLSQQTHRFDDVAINLFVNTVYLQNKAIVGVINFGFVHISGNKGPPTAF